MYIQDNTKLKPTLRLDYESPNWLQDYVVIGFDKRTFHEGEILKIVKETPKFSTKLPQWHMLEKEGETIFCVTLKGETTEENIDKIAFTQFLQENLHNPKYMNKYVAFVNGIFQDYGGRRNKLVHEMYQKFGNVRMYVGKITSERVMKRIDTPERK